MCAMQSRQPRPKALRNRQGKSKGQALQSCLQHDNHHCPLLTSPPHPAVPRCAPCFRPAITRAAQTQGRSRANRFCGGLLISHCQREGQRGPSPNTLQGTGQQLPAVQPPGVPPSRVSQCHPPGCVSRVTPSSTNKAGPVATSLQSLPTGDNTLSDAFPFVADSTNLFDL